MGAYSKSGQSLLAAGISAAVTTAVTVSAEAGQQKDPDQPLAAVIATSTAVVAAQDAVATVIATAVTATAE